MLRSNKDDVELFIDSEGIVREGRVVKRITQKDLIKLTAKNSGISSNSRNECKTLSNSFMNGLKGSFLSRLLKSSLSVVRKPSSPASGKSNFLKFLSSRKSRLEEEKLRESIRPRRRSWRSKFYGDQSDNEMPSLPSLTIPVKEEEEQKFLFDSEGNPLYEFTSTPRSISSTHSSRSKRSSRKNSHSERPALEKSNSISRSEKKIATNKIVRKSRRKSFSDGYISIDEEEREEMAALNALPDADYKAEYIKEWRRTASKNSERYSLPAPSSFLVEEDMYRSSMHQKVLRPVRLLSASGHQDPSGFPAKVQLKQGPVPKKKGRSSRKSMSDGEVSPPELYQYRKPLPKRVHSSSRGGMARARHNLASPSTSSSSPPHYPYSSSRSGKYVPPSTVPYRPEQVQYDEEHDEESSDSEEDEDVVDVGRKKSGKAQAGRFQPTSPFARQSRFPAEGGRRGYNLDEKEMEQKVTALNKEKRRELLEELKKWEWKGEEDVSGKRGTNYRLEEKVLSQSSD